MSNRADSNPFVYPVIARLAAPAVLALLFIPGALTLRGFTKYAEAIAQKHSIALVGEPGLTSMLEKAHGKQNCRILTLLDDKRKYRPRCGRTMVRRTARKGWRAGQSFWSCATYPRCSYILEVS